jgi:hypothetical protein
MTDLSYISTVNFNFINDHASGDFGSKLWAQFGFDSVRDDLLTYYQTCKDTIISSKLSRMLERFYSRDSLRRSFPNNCFTYVTGMLAKGQFTFGPDCFRYVRLWDAKRQNADISFQSYFRSYSWNKYQLRTAMQRGGFPLIKDTAESRYSFYRPIIGMTGTVKEDNGKIHSDYHFIRLHVSYTPSGPQILFLQKEGGKLPIMPTMNIERFFRNRALNQNIYNYQDPEVYLSNKSLIGRMITMTDLKNQRLQLSLNAAPRRLFL